MDRLEILKRIDKIKQSVRANRLPNVYVLLGDMHDLDINELYNHPKVRAMVSLTKGEGFGRPLLEFTLSGKPIITTNWSGHLDFLHPEYNVLLGGEVKPVHDSALVENIIIQGSSWFSPNPGEVGHYLKDVFENYKRYKEKGKRQRHYSKTNFSFEKMQELLESILDKNIPEFPKEVKLQLPTLKKIELPKLQKVNG